jgi:hypothetical protein
MVERLSAEGLLEKLDFGDRKPSLALKKMLGAFAPNLCYVEELQAVNSLVYAYRNRKASLRSSLVTLLGEPEGNVWDTFIQGNDAKKAGFKNGRLFLPPLESVADNNVIGCIYSLAFRLRIPIEFEVSEELSVDERHKYFHRSLPLFIRELSNMLAGEIRVPRVRTSSELMVHVSRALVLRELMGDKYRYAIPEIKELCGDFKDKIGGWKAVARIIPANVAPEYISILKVLVKKVALDLGNLTILDSCYEIVSECLDWKTRRIRKRGIPDKIVRFKPHTTSNIRYLPTQMKDTWFESFPHIKAFKLDYEVHHNTPATEEVIRRLNINLEKAYKEFFPFRRTLRALFNISCKMHEVKEADRGEFEVVYTSDQSYLMAAKEFNPMLADEDQNNQQSD